MTIIVARCEVNYNGTMALYRISLNICPWHFCENCKHNSSVSPAVKFFETSQEIDKDDDPISSDVLKVENFQYSLKIHNVKHKFKLF